MTRRLFGPVGGPIAFFLVAALVFAGLGWVTYSALGVERSQRESAARVEIGHNLRIALWQLDSRMLPALGVEDSRPYYHYAPPDPAATPLFVANLPDWMKLHFQLDPVDGWTSPLVCTPAVADKVREAWAEVTPYNMSPERAQVLQDLRFRCPAGSTLEQFAATDRSIPSDSLSLAAPLVAGDVQAETYPIPPSAGGSQVDPLVNSLPGVNAGRTGALAKTVVVRLFGIELCLEPDGSTNQYRSDFQQQAQQFQKRSTNPGQAGDNPRGQSPMSPMSQIPGPGSRGGGGRLAQKDSLDNEKQVADWMNRAGLMDRAIREAKNAAEFQMPKGQLLGNYGNNYLPNIDLKNSANTLGPAPGNRTGGAGPPSAPSSTPGAGAGVTGGVGGPGQPVGPQPGPVGSPRDEKVTLSKEFKESPVRPGALDVQRVTDKYAETPQAATERDQRRVLDPVDAALLAHELSSCVTQPRSLRLRRIPHENGQRDREEQRFDGAQQPTVPPTPPATPILPPVAHTVPSPAPGQPTAIHLGSMRPQWLTAPDGSDILVLVRAAKVDDKVVYQGVVVDWPKLSAALSEEIQPLFPQARLVPIKDTSAVYPDRAMTALPVQLDPGPDSELPPAGWTPLRIGLVLAWLAAIIAFAAVGFAGWGLMDLAERRIRFVSAVTHELRTPLTSLRLYLDLLVSGMIQDEEKRREYLATLAVESDRLHRLIDNVLDYAKLEKRKQNGDIKAVPLGELLDHLRATWTDRVAIDGKELLVISTLPADRTVNTDAAMVQQIVGNLIDNARKYTRDAADKRIWVWAKPGPGSGVVLEVEDRGAGVPASERKSIFKPFRRGEQADSKAGGAGLGLALAKSWAEVLGGTLTYRPADGGTGACFRLELPGK